MILPLTDGTIPRTRGPDSEDSGFMSRSLYEKYGGFASINRVVIAFYDSVLDSDRLAPFFDEVDMARLIDHQTQMVAALLGGPAYLEESKLERSHRRLAISNGDFDELLSTLTEILRKEGFSGSDIQTVVNAFEARRQLIVKATP